MTVRVRIAPSPTGDPHVGTAYIALFNYAFAQKNGGKFILRIEDTDRARSTRASEDAIIGALKWLGLTWDEGPDCGGAYGPYRQSERLDIYKEHVQLLLDKGHAYKCIRTDEELAELRSNRAKLKQHLLYPEGYDSAAIEAKIASGADYVVRLKTPLTGEAVVGDLLRGDVHIAWTEVDDQILQKGDGFPTYHLANVVDDHLMGITHVFRGEEWISSGPKHVLLYDCFGWQMPLLCHLPLLRNEDKSKVSKRKNPVSLNYFKQAGYLPDALVNFLGMLAFTFADEREVFDLAEFAEEFAVERIVLGGPVFDMKKLLWLNGRYLREKRTPEQYAAYLQERLFSKEYLLAVTTLVQARVEKSEDLIAYAPYFFTGSVNTDPEQLLIDGLSKKKNGKRYEELVERIDGLYDFTPDNIKACLKQFCADKDLTPKQLFMPVRLMVAGQKKTPPLFETMSVLGRERCRTRMREAIKAFKAFTPK